MSAPHRSWPGNRTSHPAPKDATPTGGEARAARVARRPLLGRPQDLEHRHRQDLQIQPQRPVLDVVVVPLDAIAQRGLAAEAVDLGPAGDAGLDAVAVAVAADVGLEQLDELRALRARAHQRHVAAQDVEELRQLVEGRAAQQPPDPGAAVDALDAARRAALAGAEALGGGVGRAHRAELVEVEERAVATDAALAEDDRAGRG